MTYKIFNPKEDMQGNAKENIFIVMDDKGYVGNGFVFPKISSLTPLHPLNIFIDMSLDEKLFETDLAERLYHRLKRRAIELSQVTGLRSLLYYGSEKADYKTSFFKKMDFSETLHTLKLTRHLDPILHKTLDYKILIDNHDSHDDLIELHNKTLIKPIDDEVIHKLSHKEDFAVFKVYDDRLIASMLIYKEDGQGFIDHIVVDKAFRGKSIGTYLLAEAIDYFRVRFCKCLELEVWSANVKAMTFYDKYDFQTGNVTEIYVGKHL